jgi:hypothetical protein
MKYTLELEEADVNIIVAALYEMPYKNVANVLNTIIKSVSDQQKSTKDKGDK